MYIVVQNDKFFIVDVVDDTDMAELREIVDAAGKENLKLYFTIYRTMLGIPLEATPKEERQMLTERFGPDVLDNKEFISSITMAQSEFESNKRRMPDVLMWLVEKGAEVTPADGYFQV